MQNRYKISSAFDAVAITIHAHKARSSASVARHHHAVCGKSIITADLVVFFHRLARRTLEKSRKIPTQTRLCNK